MDPSVRNLCVRSMTQLNGVLLSLRFIVFGLFDNHQRPADEESRGRQGEKGRWLVRPREV